MRDGDWDEVAEIYRLGIATGNATFETTVPHFEEWADTHPPALRLVAVDGDNTIVGWAAGTPVSGRPVYAGVVEHSVYVHPDSWGRGVAGLLLDAFIDATEAEGIWTIQSAIFPENEASLALHRRHGFRVVGRRERLGKIGSVWRDVIMIERRSPVVG